MGDINIENEVNSSALTKRIHKVLELRLENDKETLDALKELSTFYPENTAENRRNLKSVIERRTLSINGQFLTSLKKVQGTLDVIYKDVNQMNTTITEMRNQLSSTKSKTKTLIDATTKLQKQVKDVSNKQQIASAFIDKFQLTSNELAALRSRMVTPDMFTALEKTEQIHSSCRLLMQAGCQAAAQDIMDQMTMLQEAGMERLFRWTQSRCRSIETPDPHGLLPRAMARLQARQQLFRQVLEEYSANRRDLLVRQFIDALTRGGRPIELRATEPKRYVGDMLAWLHQAVPAEKDNLTLMLRDCEGIDCSETVQQVLGDINEGVCHPLRVRIEHILLGEDNVREPALLYSIFNLLRYYRGTIGQVVGTGQLDRTLSELVQAAEQTFLLSLQTRVAVVLGGRGERGEAPSGDLQPGPAVGKALALLGNLLAADSAAEGRLAHVAQMVSCVVDPVIMHVTESAVKLPPVEVAVYLLNSFHLVQTVLALHPFLDERLERLRAQCEAQLDTLTSEQASNLVSHLGLGPVYTLLQNEKPDKPLSQCLDPAIIAAIHVKLEKLLATPDLYHLPQLSLLSSNTQRQSVQRRAGEVVGAIYTALYQAVHEPANAFQDPMKLLSMPSDAVTKALSS